MKRAILTSAVFSFFFAGALVAGDGPRYSEALDIGDTRIKVEEMLKDQPKWVQYVGLNGGVGSGGYTITLEDQIYNFAKVCKPHECNMKRISMMVGEDGAVYLRVYGTKTEEQFFGDPSAKIKEVMRAQG